MEKKYTLSFQGLIEELSKIEQSKGVSVIIKRISEFATENYDDALAFFQEPKKNDLLEQQFVDRLIKNKAEHSAYSDNKTLYDFSAFLRGYSSCFEWITNYRLKFFSDFQSLVSLRLNNPGGYSWEGLLSLGKSDEEAVSCFYGFLQEMMHCY